MAIRNVNLGGARDWIDGELMSTTDTNNTFSIIATMVNAGN